MAILLAPSLDEVSELLTQNLGVGNALTAWSHALLNIALYPLNPKPDWYDSMSAKLAVSHGTAEQWVNGDGPLLASSVPQSLINYGNLLVASADDIMTTVRAISSAPRHRASPDQIASLSSAITTLLQTAEQQRALAAKMRQSAKTFAVSVRAQHADIAADVAAASKTLHEDERLVTEYEDGISALEQKLGIDVTKAKAEARDALVSGGSMVAALLFYSIMTIATDGAAMPVMAIVFATTSITLNGVLSSVAAEDVQRDLAKLFDLETKLIAVSRQVIGLKSIVNVLRRLLDCNDAVQNALDDLVPMWDDVMVRLQFVAEVLRQPSVDVTLVSSLMSFADSATAWQKIIDNATNVQSSSFTMTQPITLNQKAPRS